MKTRQRGYAEPVFVFISVVCAVLIGGALWLSSASCSAAWSKSGMATSWGPIQGCLVQTPSGRWVPAERVREIDLEPRKPAAEIPK